MQIPRVASAREYSRFVIKDLLRDIATDFVQIIQWDGYVINGPAWTNEFLDYDYIGARWWFRKHDRNVGNGGFSLRSRRLLEALQDAAIPATQRKWKPLSRLPRSTGRSLWHPHRTSGPGRSFFIRGQPP